MTKLFFGLICLSSFSLYASDQSALNTSWMSPQEAALMQTLNVEAIGYIKTLDRKEQRILLLEAKIGTLEKAKQEFTDKKEHSQEQPGIFRDLDALFAPYGLNTETFLNECVKEFSSTISSLQDELKPLKIEEHKSQE